MGMGKGNMNMLNIYFDVLQHAWSQTGYCYVRTPIRNTFRFRRGLCLELDFPQHKTKGGTGDRFQQITMR